MDDRIESFVFYASFADAMEELDDAQYGKLMRAINKYAIYGIEPELSGMLRMAFILIKPQLDANNKRRVKSRQGGAKEKNNNASKYTMKKIAEYYEQNPNASVNECSESLGISKSSVYNFLKTQKEEYEEDADNDDSNSKDFPKQHVKFGKNSNEIPKDFPKQPNVNCNNNVNVNCNDNLNYNSNSNLENEKNNFITNFKKPKLLEVVEYCKNKKYTVDPEKYYNYYEANGWYCGSKPMNNWRASIDSWQKRENEKYTSTSMQIPEYDYNAVGNIGEKLF